MTISHLLCRAGLHRPLPNGRWNGGYCFTACARCGRDMVRSIFGEWHVPKDFRVVWDVRRPGEPDASERRGGPVRAKRAAGTPSDRPAAPLRARGDTSPFDFDDFE